MNQTSAQGLNRFEGFVLRILIAVALLAAIAISHQLKSWVVGLPRQKSRGSSPLLITLVCFHVLPHTIAWALNPKRCLQRRRKSTRGLRLCVILLLHRCCTVRSELSGFDTKQAPAGSQTF